MEKVISFVVLLVIGTAFALFGAAITAYFLAWFVNFTFAPSAIAAVFGTPVLGFWKAFGLFTVASWLFKTDTSSKKD